MATGKVFREQRIRSVEFEISGNSSRTISTHAGEMAIVNMSYGRSSQYQGSWWVFGRGSNTPDVIEINRRGNNTTLTANSNGTLTAANSISNTCYVKILMLNILDSYDDWEIT